MDEVRIFTIDSLKNRIEEMTAELASGFRPRRDRITGEFSQYENPERYNERKTRWYLDRMLLLRAAETQLAKRIEEGERTGTLEEEE